MQQWEGMEDESVLAAYLDASGSRAARDGAFHELVRRYERRVYGITYRYFGNHADAEDAAQDTFLTLARRADQFRGDAKLSTWVYRIATNACTDLARKRARRPQTTTADVGEERDADPSPSPDEHAVASELADQVQQALLTLDELSRTLIILCAIQGQSYADVAQTLDLPVGTIKSRVFRARAKLADLLRPFEQEDTPAPARADVVVDTDADPRPRPRGPPPERSR